MMADFNAVKELSKTVGGVEVCISDAVYDPDSRLRLPKGTSKVQGEQALAFLRARHAFADGGDLGRIKAQQGLLPSLTRKMKSDGTLSNPVKMLEIADVVTKNLTIDEGLASIPTLLTVGNRVKTSTSVRSRSSRYRRCRRSATPTACRWPSPRPPSSPPRCARTLTSRTRRRHPAPLRPRARRRVPAPTPTPSETAPAYDKSLQPVTVANGSGTPSAPARDGRGPHRHRIRPDQPVRRPRPVAAYRGLLR